jgi:anaerobic magnesium-protoporphyrin IX monomethyl ester cyclase
MIDCLILGFNDPDFGGYVDMVKGMGVESGGFRDLNLAFVEYDNQPQRSLDLLTRFHYEGKKGPVRPFHNADFLWPVVTYLGTYLKRKGLTVDYVNLPHLERDKLKEILLHNEILTVAITTTLYVSMHPILDLVSFIRQHNESAKIVVGGPYISNQPKLGDDQALQRLLKYIDADLYVISSEGEAALANLIWALKTKSPLDNIDNIVYREGKRFVVTAASIESNALEENLVDYSLFAPQEIDEFITTRTAKSCPFSCSFCGFPQRAGKYNYLSVELVEQELNAIRDIGSVTTITFIDDTFNVPKERFREILRMMIRNNYGFKWNSFYRSDHGDDATIDLMGKAGCEGVFLGIESGSDAMLKRMNKTARRKDYLRAIPRLRDAGVSTHANIIVGFPGETYETFQESIDLIESVKPDFYRAQLWYADPITPIWDKREEYGIQGSMFNWVHDTMDCETACDLVEKMFLCIDGSVWLPQNGFEQWSTFYLQRRGMSMDQLKTFVRSFNALVKEKLIYPDKKEADPGLVEALKRSSRFDRPEQPDMAPVEALSGNRYFEAERFCLTAFGAPTCSSNIAMLKNDILPPDEGMVTAPIDLDFTLVEEAQASCGVGTGQLLLAAFTAVLSRLNDREELVVLADTGDGLRAVVPLRLFPEWSISFKDLVFQAQGKLDETLEHSTHALHIVSNPFRMAEHGAAAPVFDVGFALGGNGISKALEAARSVAKTLALVLVVKDRGVELQYRKGWFKSGLDERINACLASVLKQATTNPDVALGDIILDGSKSQENSLSIAAHRGEYFHFDDSDSL